MIKETKEKNPLAF